MSDTFRSPLFRSGTIISSGGYSVALRSRYALEYRESDLRITANYDAATTDLDLLTESFVVWSHDHLVTLTVEAMERIQSNIKAALTWKGYRVHFVASA